MDKDAQDPRWGADDRESKAHAILVTLRQFMPEETLRQALCVDMGCGSGEIAFHIAGQVHTMTGIDPEPWARWEGFQASRSNLRYLNESAEAVSLADSSVDLVICNQVYEHVPRPRHLIAEIYRILKPGGHCYFAGPNLLFPIEPHVFWPFIHWLPRNFAVNLMRVCGSQGILDANSTHYWALRKWLDKFHIQNCVPYILRNPEPYRRSSLLWRSISHVPAGLLNAVTWISPGFVFVLQKPV